MRRAVRSAAIRLPDVFAPRTRLIVGFSGGQDSTCLLHALANAHRKLDLLAVHVDHGLRPDSAEQADQVVQRAAEIGVVCEVVRVDVAAHKGKRTSLQQAARAARYEALAERAKHHAAEAVLVAHTSDDQAETVLLNLLRGSGLQGLAAMRMDSRTEQGVRLVRALLTVPRLTTLAYCTHFGLSLVDDASNQTRAYARNRVRLDLLPALEQFNPAIRVVLSRLAALAADDIAALDVVVAELYPRLVHDQRFDLQQFRAQPRALQRRLLRFGLAAISGGVVDVGDAPVEDAIDLVCSGQPTQTYHLPYGVELEIGSTSFCLRGAGGARQRQLQKNGKVVGSRV